MRGTARTALRAAHGQRGFALIAAIFLIVVLAGLGVFAARVRSTQQQTSSFAILEARAQAAAQAGIESGANLALAAVPKTCPATRSWTLSEASLAGFTVKVTCASQPHPGVSYRSYVLVSTATKGTYGRADFVSRQVTRTVTDAP
ncbi:MAG TPA: hypothetical protein VGM84_24915 [Steroidobacteraceae bacterium]|jgi:MSHA biogenesis protein MshP